MNNTERPNNVPDNGKEETASHLFFLDRKTIEFTQSDSRITKTKSLPITYVEQNYSSTTVPLSLSSDQNGDSFIVSNCTFINCSNSQSSGGAIYSSISNGAIVSFDETQFIDCYCVNEGGAIFITVTSGSEVHFESCSMNNCFSAKNGGGLYILILSSYAETAAYLSNLYIQNCSCYWHGGGIYIDARDNVALSLIGEFMFDKCSSVGENFNGGGICIEMSNPQQSIHMEGDYTFFNCSSELQGGGMYIAANEQKPILINCNCLFQNCTSTSGGGMLISYWGSGDLTQLGGNFTFESCNAQLFGGGLFIESASNGFVQIDDFTFLECSSRSGGGIFWSLVKDSKQIINRGQFNYCYTTMYGGGISVQFSSNSELILNNSCLFFKCNCLGCGGAIYANINYNLPFQFNISDSAVYECLAEHNPYQAQYQSGFGGGIFLTGNGDYDPSTESLDFRGMNINLNFADYGGQSLYVVMPNLIQFCQSGIAGEYIKGNYSDKYSDYEEIEGIQADQITFNSLSLEQIEHISHLKLIRYQLAIINQP
ncbi:MAG: hypothetical protein EZS28_008959 [Streblomastix strix]|uniref:Right handed beta helix domain-containing protein n=1 Tax=Streblomastix strix TaxID=222440 RepID=A0A5J4WKT4_9EUKA|nr:MAG: hypothetical protein EZS28_008959 [Streblomastix strix]